MTCKNCNSNPCGCTKTKTVWQPSLTVERACHIVHSLLATADCFPVCPDWELCRLIKFQCELCRGAHPVAVLAMLTAAQMLETEAIKFARKGNVSTLTIKFNGNQTSSELREIAATWRKMALECTNQNARRFAIVKTGKSCLKPSMGLNKLGCYCTPSKIDDRIIINCNWDCCEGDCEDDA